MLCGSVAKLEGRVECRGVEEICQESGDMKKYDTACGAGCFV